MTGEANRVRGIGASSHIARSIRRQLHGGSGIRVQLYHLALRHLETRKDAIDRSDNVQDRRITDRQVASRY